MRKGCNFAKMIKSVTLVLIFFCAQTAALAQDSGYVARHLQLDSVVISASKVNFDIPGFIKMVREDTTFYKAFKTMRILAYTGHNDIRILDKSGKVSASLNSTTRQHRDDDCRTMEVKEEKTSGDFYDRKGRYNYYTAELYASLFFTQGEVCGETNIVAGAQNSSKGGSLEKHKEQLKELIFNPGQPIYGIPVVGRKVAIFDDKVAPMYNFSITAADYNGTPCYVFTAQAKPGYKKNVVINRLVTYFSKDNLEIVFRNYSLSYDVGVFDFDVKMQVRMTHFEQYLVPSEIHYDGNWKVPFRKREHAEFRTRFSDFSLKG